MGAMILLLGEKLFNAFVSRFVVCLNICRWLGGKVLIKHVADKFYPKIFHLDQKKISLSNHQLQFVANDFQAVFGPDIPKAQSS